MNIFDFFKFNRKTSANVAKERLQILVSHERLDSSTIEFLPELRNELIEVISKYIKIDKGEINVQLQRKGNHSTLEMNVSLPEVAEVAVDG